MKTNSPLQWLTSREGVYYLLLALLLLVVLPLSLDAFRLNMVGKYLTYAFAAIGLVMCWGKAGILSLGQGVFFGLGGYCMAMFLKLEASTPEATRNQSTPGIPDFMDWNQITELPGFWQPFHSFSFTLIAVIAVPVLLAFIIGVAMFTRRVGGVLRDHYPGDRRHPHHSDHRPAGSHRRRQRHHRPADADGLEYPHRRRQVDALFCLRGPVVSQFIRLPSCPERQAGADSGGDARPGDPGAFLRLRRGLVQGLRLLPRRRPGGHRRCPVHPAGGFHVAVVRGHRAVHRDGGVLRAGRPLFPARRRLRRTAGERGQERLLESFPELWPYAMGALFIGVVLAFPNGLAGLYERYIMPLEKRLPVIGKYLDKDSPEPQAPPVVSDQLSAEKP